MSDIIKEIETELFALQDEKYRDFSAKLTPTSYPILGVRTPELRAFASELGRREDITLFLRDVPHTFLLVVDLRDADYRLCGWQQDSRVLADLRPVVGKVAHVARISRGDPLQERVRVTRG